MINRKFFFDQVRLYLFGGRLSQKQVDGLTAILDGWEDKYAKRDDRRLAYMLATTHHETDRKMWPIEQYGKAKGDRTAGRTRKPGNGITAVASCNLAGSTTTAK